MERQEAIGLLKSFFIKKKGTLYNRSFYVNLIRAFFAADEVDFKFLKKGFPILGKVIEDYKIGKINLEKEVIK